ncbi:hypothetical protein E5H11_24025, partial [Escherichia coli]|nr:hypothetical protein [Escherichia coli]
MATYGGRFTLTDILIACVDGLKGFPDAIYTVYPARIQLLCIKRKPKSTMETCFKILQIKLN